MKRVFKITLFFIAAIITVIVYLAADLLHFLNYTTDLNENCKSLNELGNYLDYDMLIKDLKKEINESDFKFEDDRDLYIFCSKYKDLDYHYEGYKRFVFPTCKIGKVYDVLIKDISIDGAEYTVCIDFSIKPGLFFNTEIVDVNTAATPHLT